MPFNGSGTFEALSPPTYPAVAGTTITASYFNSVINDLITGFNNCITRDGQGKPSAAINWNAQNLTNIAVFSCTGNGTVGGNLTVTGTSAFTGAATFAGNVTLGDASSDTVTVNATPTFNTQIWRSGSAATNTIIEANAGGGGVTGTLSYTVTLNDVTGFVFNKTLTVQGNFSTTGNTTLGDASTDRAGIWGGATISGAATPFLAFSVDQGGTTSGYIQYDIAGNFMQFAANSAERARIDSSGNLLVGTTGAISPGGVVSAHRMVSSAGTTWTLGLQNSSAADPRGIGVVYSAASPNTASQQFLYCTDSTGQRMAVYANGGIANYSANNVNLSDEREKPHIKPFDAAADLEAFMAFPFVDYKYRDQTHDDWNLGTGAQSALASHPGNARFVDLDSWQKPVKDADGNDVLDDDGNPVTEVRMAVYDGDIHYRTGAQAQYAHRLIKLLQGALEEQAARIETLEARLAAAGIA